MAPGAEVLEEVDRNELLGEALDSLLSPPIEKELEDALIRILLDISKPKMAEALSFLYDRRTEITPFLDSIKTKDDILARWKDLQANSQKEMAERFLQDQKCMQVVVTDD